MTMSQRQSMRPVAVEPAARPIAATERISATRSAPDVFAASAVATSLAAGVALLLRLPVETLFGIIASTAGGSAVIGGLVEAIVHRAPRPTSGFQETSVRRNIQDVLRIVRDQICAKESWQYPRDSATGWLKYLTELMPEADSCHDEILMAALARLRGKIRVMTMLDQLGANDMVRPDEQDPWAEMRSELHVLVIATIMAAEPIGDVVEIPDRISHDGGSPKAKPRGPGFPRIFRRQRSFDDDDRLLEINRRIAARTGRE